MKELIYEKVGKKYTHKIFKEDIGYTHYIYENGDDEALCSCTAEALEDLMSEVAKDIAKD